MAFRIFTSAVLAGASWAVGALFVWLMGQLKLPPDLQAHHPFVSTSDLFRQTQQLFLGTLAACGAMAGYVLPAHRYGTRKWVELEATARALALLWGLLAGIIAVAAAFLSAAIWPFVLLSAVVSGLGLLAARVARAAQRRTIRHPWASDMVPLMTDSRGHTSAL